MSAIPGSPYLDGTIRISSGPIHHPCGCQDWMEFTEGEWVQRHHSCHRHREPVESEPAGPQGTRLDRSADPSGLTG